MKIEFLMNGISDIAKIYNKKMESFPFDGEEVPSYEYIGQAYCESVVTKAAEKIAGIQEFSYQGDFERMANEVFVLHSASKRYTVLFTIDTYKYEKARLLVTISAEDRDDVETLSEGGVIEAGAGNQQKYSLPDGEEYDILLEVLKLELKEALRPDWKSCAWIVDEQSEMLCTNLYPLIFKAENNLRAFANKVLVHSVGPDWLKQPGLEKYRNSHSKLSSEFKREVPCFANIDDTFIAMTLESMMEVIKKAKIYDETIELSDSDYELLHKKLVFDTEAKSLMAFLQKKRHAKISFWDDIFKQYFEPENIFQQTVTAFIKNRNHVAHNKLLNWSAYQKMLQTISSLDNIVRKANSDFERSVPSEELYMTWQTEADEARDEQAMEDWERNYLRARIEGETGVEILHEDGIYDKFCERLDAFYTEISDVYYFDPQFSVSGQYGIDMEAGEQVFFDVTSNAVESGKIEVIVQMSLDGDMDSDSELQLSCRKADSKEILFSAAIYYHNGSGWEDYFEGTVEVDSNSEYDDSELEEFKQRLKEYIDDELNPLISELEAMEYEAGRHGGKNPVADFPCAECGKLGISVLEDFYPFGRCCYCGMENDVYVCDLCGAVFGDGEGKNGICNACLHQRT